MTHAQVNIKRLEMSTKTPGRQQNPIGKEVNRKIFYFFLFDYFLFIKSEIKPITPFRPTSGIHKR